MQLLESSLVDLYRSAVLAFPNTTKRQHAVHPVEVLKLEWTPFLGMKTLFIKGFIRNEDRHYNTIVLLKGLDYSKDDTKIIANDGLQYSFGPLSMENTNVNLRCNCPDFHWRFNYYDHLDKSLYGRKRAKYEGTTGIKANPLEMPGICKHLMKTAQALDDAGLFKSNKTSQR